MDAIVLVQLVFFRVALGYTTYSLMHIKLKKKRQYGKVTPALGVLITAYGFWSSCQGRMLEVEEYKEIWAEIFDISYEYFKNAFTPRRQRGNNVLMDLSS